MRFRLTAFGLHLLGSACVLTLVLGGLYLGWYHWPGWYLTAVTRILVIVGLVDLGLGPTLTLIIANPKKPRRVLARDIAMIVSRAVRGARSTAPRRCGRADRSTTLSPPTAWRPCRPPTSRMRRSRLRARRIRPSRRTGTACRAGCGRRCQRIRTRRPTSSNPTVFGGGQDVIDMPRYFKPWERRSPGAAQAVKNAGSRSSTFPSRSRPRCERAWRASGSRTEQPNATRDVGRHGAAAGRGVRPRQRSRSGP